MQHEPWCNEHLDDRDSCGNGEICTIGLPDFGPSMTDGNGDSYPRGSLFIDQQEDQDEPAFHIEFAPGRTGAFDLDAARSIYEALKADPETLKATLELAFKMLGLEVPA
ncbi:MAG: hypothetical protein JWP56_1815 [Aeromicrobium sp.]|nr:hypothetical protein [Aeromicrobium sp.]